MAVPLCDGASECAVFAQDTDTAGRRHRHCHRPGLSLAAPLGHGRNRRVVEPNRFSIAAVFMATILIAVLGAVDDIKPMGVVPRLLFQVIAVASVIAVLPSDFQMTPFLPWWLERALLVLAGVWFVNLVNFMDGLDWMTVAEMVPVVGGLVLLGALGVLPAYAVIAARWRCLAR